MNNDAGLEKRRQLRYKTMTILYQINLYQNNGIDFKLNDIINEYVQENSLFVNTLVKGVINTSDRLEKIANTYLKNWNINRLSYIDAAILKMGIYELLYMDTPDKICIDEAINLSKKYSDEKVCKMINVVLDRVYHSKVNNGK